MLVLSTPFIVAAAVDAIHNNGAGLFGDAIKVETRPQFASRVRHLCRLPDPPPAEIRRSGRPEGRPWPRVGGTNLRDAPSAEGTHRRRPAGAL